MLSADEIEDLSVEEPRAALDQPNCPVDLWWLLAALHPIQATRSVLFGLLTLEDPARWINLVSAKNISRWIARALLEANLEERELFAADCAARVLPLFEAQYPEDSRPRAAIATRRLWARGGATRNQWEAAQAAGKRAAFFASWAPLRGPSLAARAAAGSPALATVWAAKAVASTCGGLGPPLGWAAYDAERRWQWERLCVIAP